MNDEKQKTIYNNSYEALLKTLITIFTFGISFFALRMDFTTYCITVIVQSSNNIYDFIRSTDNRKYHVLITVISITVVIMGLFSILIAITELTNNSLLPISKGNVVILLLFFTFTVIPAEIYNYVLELIKENSRKEK